MAGLVVEVSSDFPAAEEWDELVRLSAAPLLYRSGPLLTYLRFPLQEGTEAKFVTARDASTGECVVAFPVFILPPVDPLGVMADAVKGYSPTGGSLVLSHVWHWYDTRVPARPNVPGLGPLIRETLRDLGRSVGAQVAGLINVSVEDPLLEELSRSGFQVVPVDRRFRAELSSWSTPDDWLQTLDRHVRQDVRRQIRRAYATGCEVTVGPPDTNSVEDAAELCALTGGKHGNPDWYDASQLARLIWGWRDNVVLTTIARGGLPLASSVSLLDGVTFHNWAAGTADQKLLGFSPYTVLLHATIREAIARGCTRLEGGRRNEDWKRRRGLSPLELYGAFLPL